MSTQQALALPSPAASNTVVINARCSLRIEAGQRVIVVAGLPVHHYRAEDAVAEAYATVFLVESGFAQQTDVARAFARSVRTVRRYQGRYAQGSDGSAGGIVFEPRVNSTRLISSRRPDLDQTVPPLSLLRFIKVSTPKRVTIHQVLDAGPTKSSHQLCPGRICRSNARCRH